MLNKVFLIGNLGRDPLMEITQNGKQIAKFSLATSSKWKNETGQWHKHTDWHHVIVFKEITAEWIKDTFKKGDRVYVEGKLIYHSWISKQGDTRRSSQIVVSGNNGQVIHLPRYCLSGANDFSELDPISEGFMPESFNSESLDPKGLGSENQDSKNQDSEKDDPEDHQPLQQL